MVGMYFKRNKIGKQRIDLLRENEVILELGNLLKIGVEKLKISHQTIRYLRGHRGDRELRPCNLNIIINFSVCSVVNF